MEIKAAEELARVAMASGIAEIQEKHRKLGEDADEKIRRATIEHKKKLQQGISNIRRRQTYVIKNKHIEAIRAIAYWERRKINDVANDVFEFYINSYEHLNGSIKPKPNT